MKTGRAQITAAKILSVISYATLLIFILRFHYTMQNIHCQCFLQKSTKNTKNKQTTIPFAYGYSTDLLLNCFQIITAAEKIKKIFTAEVGRNAQPRRRDIVRCASQFNLREAQLHFPKATSLGAAYFVGNEAFATQI